MSARNHDLFPKAGRTIRYAWRTWLRPAIATIGRGNFHVDRMG